MKCIYCIVDLHAITVYQKPDELRTNVLETLAGFLAAGIDPDKSIIFNQSCFRTHRISLDLNCVSRVGWLNQ